MQQHVPLCNNMLCEWLWFVYLLDYSFCKKILYINEQRASDGRQVIRNVLASTFQAERLPSGVILHTCLDC